MRVPVYLAMFLLSILLIGLLFLLLSRLFRVVVKISESSIIVRGLRVRRWSLHGVQSVQFVPPRKISFLTQKNAPHSNHHQLVIEEWALSKDERNWINTLLDQFIAMKREAPKSD
jgi:hypothetical protein